MHNGIDRIRKVRAFFLDLISGFSAEQMNTIPAGFHNNLVWHLGHLLATEQSMIYVRNELPLQIDEKYIEQYKPGTKPGPFVNEEEIEKMKSLFIAEVDQMEADFNNGLFNDFKPWKNRYGMDIDTFDDAVSFLLFHEGLHCGYVMSQKHSLS